MAAVPPQADDDTQPRSPLTDVGTGEAALDDAEQTAGPGCLALGLVGFGGLGLAVVIIGLAALAGWTSGQRTADEHGTATRRADVAEQCGLIEQDVSSQNTALLSARLAYLTTLTPGVACIENVDVTATAVHFANQPTVTLTPSNTPTATLTATMAATPEATAEGFAAIDLGALLVEAQGHSALREWDEAIALLDVIMAVDSSFQSGVVRSLMSEALNMRALELYRANELAEAILLTDRAEEFGPLAEGLNFERLVASRYLDAQSFIGTSYPQAIAALREVVNLAPNYQGGTVQQQLLRQYLDYGDALVGGGEVCAATIQFQNALDILASGEAQAKRDNAELLCTQITPTVDANTILTPVTPGAVAPVGVVETPGG